MRKVARTCNACGCDQPKIAAPDPCLGRLPGVIFACCGHGARGNCYVVMRGEPGEPGAIRGDSARDRLIELGGDPAPFAVDGWWHGQMPGWKAEGEEPTFTPLEDGVGSDRVHRAETYRA